MIFVNSMSDLFHRAVPHGFIDQVFDTMEAADHHIYQVLTKRSPLMRDYLAQRYKTSALPEHIWCGVAVEDAASMARIRHLRQAPVSVSEPGRHSHRSTIPGHMGSCGSRLMRRENEPCPRQASTTRLTARYGPRQVIIEARSRC